MGPPGPGEHLAGSIAALGVPVEVAPGHHTNEPLEQRGNLVADGTHSVGGAALAPRLGPGASELEAAGWAGRDPEAGQVVHGRLGLLVSRLVLHHGSSWCRAPGCPTTRRGNNCASGRRAGRLLPSVRPTDPAPASHSGPLDGLTSLLLRQCGGGFAVDWRTPSAADVATPNPAVCLRAKPSLKLHEAPDLGAVDSDVGLDV